MRHAPHKTMIGLIREHVIAWRTEARLSREKVVHIILEAHEQIGLATGIVFDPVTRDEDERRKVNAERVFRWLDDQSKETNLLPANFIPSILAAMPEEVRNHCLDEFLSQFGLGIRSTCPNSSIKLNVPLHLTRMTKEDAESHQAFIYLIDHNDYSSLQRAHQELTDSIDAQSEARAAVEAAMATQAAAR